MKKAFMGRAEAHAKLWASAVGRIIWQTPFTDGGSQRKETSAPLTVTSVRGGEDVIKVRPFWLRGLK